MIKKQYSARPQARARPGPGSRPGWAVMGDIQRNWTCLAMGHGHDHGHGHGHAMAMTMTNAMAMGDPHENILLGEYIFC